MAEPDQAAFWDERYATDEYLFGTAPNAFLAREVHRLPPGSKVLAVADGEGRNSVFLAQHGHRVVATDISERALDKARALAERRAVEVEYRQANLAEWQWPAEAFDAVVGIFIQFAGPELREDIFDGIHRSLKPGGLLLLEGYREEQLAYGTGGPPNIENLYTEDGLRRAFSTWEIELLDAYDAEIEEGIGHSGKSALIDLIARKRG
ncbi:MAG: SAM-dependent methyltransferase [Citromicrobium sp.]|jgi:SAM-dependent methyltransferase|uniref:SAM-dependent methyltransferase n=1 Tax=Qipengyuania flava TaxID=192812 RepID=UPI000C50D4A1|nr:SAM-dependent methyltransferase [Citromicrobium sp.]|tara:strand:- start:3288 stop:3908 length:621 start_codon:yes stop_codon:yes gene_type:complete